MSSFLTALASAKPSDAQKLPDGKYKTKIVSAQVKPGNTVEKILRLDLETVEPAQFAGRKQIKNQPLTAAGAAYVAILLQATGNEEIATNTALGESFERGEEIVMRRFVGKSIVVDRRNKPNDEVALDIDIASLG